MPTSTQCPCAPEIAHALNELRTLGETLETVDRSIPGNAALRLAYLAMHALDRAGAIVRGELDPLLGDLDDFIYVASSLIDPNGRGGYDLEPAHVKGALQAMLAPTLGDLGLRVTPEIDR